MDDLGTLIEELSPQLENGLDRDSPKYTCRLWREQVKYNSIKTKQQLHWYPLITRFVHY